jgi:acyl carrier protein
VRLEDVVKLVRAAASELLGEDIGAEGHFAAHHFDSLSAVELANAIGKAAGCELPGTLVFDYPSVQAAAQHVCGLMQPKQPLAPDQAITPQSLGAVRVPQQQYSSLIRICVSARLPPAADSGAFAPDAITTAPSSR